MLPLSSPDVPPLVSGEIITILPPRTAIGFIVDIFRLSLSSRHPANI